jgi:hypothetical protein
MPVLASHELQFTPMANPLLDHFVSRTLRPLLTRALKAVMVFSVAVVFVAGAQNISKKTEPTELYPELFILSDQVVDQQWKSSLALVNAPADLTQAEPTQCVRFGVIASGDERDRMLSSARLGFELTFANRKEIFAHEPAESVKQVKPEGGDFVSEALEAGGVQNFSLSTASMAASRARWCVPANAETGPVVIRATVERPNAKPLALKPRTLKVRNFEAALKDVPFKDMATFGPWLQHYHSAPAPAELLPGLRIVALDDQARQMSNIMVFFVEALKGSPAAANEIIRVLPNEDRHVRVYSLPLLRAAGYDTASSLSGFSEDEKSLMASFHFPDPFDLKPDRTLPSRMDMLWASFFASGRIEPVRTVASMLGWRSDYDKLMAIQKSGQKPTEVTESTMRGLVYSAAGWSLNALSRSDGAVADYIDALKSSPDTSAEVKEELAHLHTNPAFTMN